MTSTQKPATLKLTETVVRLSYYLLLTVFFGRAIQLFTAGQSLVVVIFLLVIQIVPLLIFLPGIRKNHLRSHAWLCFAVLMYFIYAVLTAFTSGTFWYGLILSLLIALLFCALVMHIHLSRKLLGTTLQ